MCRVCQSVNGVMHSCGWLQVVALCSEHHTEVSLVADYCSSLSFWCAARMASSVLPAVHRLQPLHCFLLKHMPCAWHQAPLVEQESPACGSIIHLWVHASLLGLAKHAVGNLDCHSCRRSSLPTRDAPLQQPPQQSVQPYDRHKTYIAIIASDGDNMQACLLTPCMA